MTSRIKANICDVQKCYDDIITQDNVTDTKSIVTSHMMRMRDIAEESRGNKSKKYIKIVK